MRILIVDDDASIRECVGEQLRLRGHEPVVAADLSGAMRVLRTEAIDALVADGLLPAGDPQETPMGSWGILLVLYARLRGIPGALLTGYDHVAEEARRVGVPALLKPVGVEKILDALTAESARGG
jgi:DNA-binding NtrC family response regulator